MELIECSFFMKLFLVYKLGKQEQLPTLCKLGLQEMDDSRKYWLISCFFKTNRSRLLFQALKLHNLFLVYVFTLHLKTVFLLVNNKKFLNPNSY